MASIGIALVLAVTAIFLARETKGLLTGESAHPQATAAILRMAGDDAAVAHANGALTFQIGPDHLMATLSAEFHDRLTTLEVETAVRRIEAAIKLAHPEIKTLFIRPETFQSWRNRYAKLAGAKPQQ